MASLVMVVIASVLAASPHTVAVDLAGLDRTTAQQIDAVALERALVLRLVQEGFAVIAADAAPHILIRLERENRAIVLTAGAASARAELETRKVRELHLELVQKATVLAREAAAELDARPSEPAPLPDPVPPKPVETPAPAPPAPSLDPPSPKWNVLAAGGVLVRAPGLDPRAVLAVRWAASPRVGLHLEAGLSPIPGAAFSAYDGALLVGVGLQVINAPAFRLELALSGGVALHTFAVAAVGAENRVDARVDAVVRPFLRATLNPASGLLVWVQIGGGVSTRAREHRLLAEVQYARGALWVDALGGLGWEL